MNRRLPLALAPALALALLALAPSPPALAQNKATSERTYVLVVAHNRSVDATVKPLRFADDDGARYWELFSGWSQRVALLSVLDPETARVHPEAARAARVPWLRNLKAEVARISAEVKRDNEAGLRTRFMFIYVGHGNVDKNGEGYINLQDQRLPRRELFKQVIDAVPAGVIHLVIDACKSFFLVSRGPETWQDDRVGRSYGAEIRAFLARDTLRARPHVGAILSTSGDEEVHEWSALRSGVFSHQLRSALSGAADINGDGRIEYSEVGAFITAANHRVKHQRARLRPFVKPPSADRSAPLLDLDRATDRVLLYLPPAHAGRFSVEDERGVRHADLHKSGDGGVRLALAQNRRYYIRHGDEESVLPPSSRGDVDLDRLERGPARSDPRGALDATYRKDLFALPLSRSFYQGYVATSDLPGVSFSLTPRQRPAQALGLDLSLGYAVSPVLLDDLPGGVQHNLAVALKKDLGQLFRLGLRAEMGASSAEQDGLDSSLYRVAVLAEGGLRLALAPWLSLGIEAALGYQASFLRQVDTRSGKENNSDDAGGLKFGSRLSATLLPWGQASRLGLLLHGGVFGHLVRVTGDTRINALPEGGAAVVVSF